MGTLLGKPFDSEMESLPSTYAWAKAQPIDQLVCAVERLRAYPVPPIDIQNATVTKLDSLEEKLHHAKTARRARMAQIAALTPSILDTAFAGGP